MVGHDFTHALGANFSLTEREAEKARVLNALEGMAGGHSDFATLLHARLVNLQETDMAEVVSPEQNEISEMKEKGFDILPHRARMVKEDLEESGTSNAQH